MKVPRIVVLIVAVSLAIILIAQNTAAVETKLLFFSISMPLAILLLVTLLIGYVLGIASAAVIDRASRSKRSA